jgi:hypothetical protein
VINRAGQYNLDLDGSVLIEAGGEQKDGANYRLMLADEASGDISWLGAFCLVAIWDRALSEAEVLKNLPPGRRPLPGECVHLIARFVGKMKCETDTF